MPQEPSETAGAAVLEQAMALVSAMLQKGHVQLALQACENLVLRWPENPSLWLTLALLREDSGLLALALGALHRSLALRPDQAEVWVNLGLLQQRLGDVDAALQSHAQAVCLRPELLGRVTMALCSQQGGEVWLSQCALRSELSRLAQAGAPFNPSGVVA